MPDPSTPAPLPKPDAILCSQFYPKGKVGHDRPEALRREFGPVLGTKMVHARLLPITSETFIVGHGDQAARDHRYWPKDHPNSGQEFYDWKDRGDGVQYGYLTDEAKAYIKETEGA